MKKNVQFLFLIGFLFLLSVCNDKDFAGEELIVIENPYEVSLETAVEKALDFMDQLYPETRSESSRAKVDATTLYRTTYPQTRGESITEIPLHVIHFQTENEEAAGFVVIVGDTRVKTPIVVFADDNEWDLSGLPEFEDIFFSTLDQFIEESLAQYAVTNVDSDDCEQIFTEVSRLTVDYDASYLRWNQNPDPYNRYMPACATGGSGGRMYAGCTTAALAQIFAHYQYPVSGGG